MAAVPTIAAVVNIAVATGGGLYIGRGATTTVRCVFTTDVCPTCPTCPNPPCLGIFLFLIEGVTVKLAFYKLS